MNYSDNSNDILTYADEDPLNGGSLNKDLWKVLIVDDEEDVHILTKLVLRDYSFEGRKLQFLSAYSAEEANRIIEENPDTALLLLDVVMEEHDSGLKVVRHIRDFLDNRFVRIIIRTGQPGRAPEHEIVSRYDINDYKTKTELTSQKLFTAVTSSLRAFRDIQTIEMKEDSLR